jgi:hypothetical protein
MPVLSLDDVAKLFQGRTGSAQAFVSQRGAGEVAECL